jgi:hypothetical protein
MVEIVERRQMLDAATGYLAGTVYFDTLGTGKFDQGDAYLPGATVSLYQAGSTTPLKTTTTDANGLYVFSQLTPGQYRLVEGPPAGDLNVASRVLSQLAPAATAGPNAIDVTVLDPNQVWVKYRGVTNLEYVGATNVVNGITTADAVNSHDLALGTTQGATNLNDGFVSDCVNDLTRISFSGGETWQAIPQPISQVTGDTTPISADHAGRIAFLYNHFGNSSLTTLQAAGLQLAIWELLYDSSPTPDFAAGNFKVVGTAGTTDQATLNLALAQAVSYFNMSVGHSETAAWLEAKPDATAGKPDGLQSMVAEQSFDFLDNKAPHVPQASISGHVYCDENNDGIFESTEMPIANTTITLTGTNDLGAAVHLVTKTDATGTYLFANLRPGVYTLTETRPAGYLDGKTTQGTPGNGVVGVDMISSISLHDGVYGVNNNFAVHVIPVTVTNTQLFGIHHQTSQVVLTFSGPLDPAKVQNPANYKLIGLGKDEVFGTKDDYVIPIMAVVYDGVKHTATIYPAEHLNIHYHYVLAVNVPGTPCHSGVSDVTVFGRAQVPVWNLHGKIIPAPPQLPWEVAHNVAVVQRTLATIHNNPSLLLTAGASVHALRRG